MHWSKGWVKRAAMMRSWAVGLPGRVALEFTREADSASRAVIQRA